MTTYIHYGSDKFDKAKFGKIKNQKYPWNKPDHSTGLWASRVDAKYSWKEWCEDNDFNTDELTKSFKFTISPSANVYTIAKPVDVIGLPDHIDEEYDNPYSHDKHIDFEKCLELGIDAIEIVDICGKNSNYRFGDFTVYDTMYGWDCDSILILNPDIIETIA